jgi:hypothetical protein
MLTNFTSGLSGVELLGLWVMGAVTINAGMWAALTLRPKRIVLAFGLASGLCFALILCAVFTKLVT